MYDLKVINMEVARKTSALLRSDLDFVMENLKTFIGQDEYILKVINHMKLARKNIMYDKESHKTVSHFIGRILKEERIGRNLDRTSAKKLRRCKKKIEKLSLEALEVANSTDAIQRLSRVLLKEDYSIKLATLKMFLLLSLHL